MDDAGYFEAEAEIWHWVDRGDLIARLSGGASPPSPAEIEEKFLEFFEELLVRLGRRRLDDARDWFRIYEACVQCLNVAPIRDGLDDAGLYSRGLEILPLLGEKYFSSVVDDPSWIKRLEGASKILEVGAHDSISNRIRDRWRDELLVEITDAFASVAYPGDRAVISSDWGTDEECRYFCGRDWQTLDPLALHRRCADLVFVEEAGFRYLLPAFMRASILDRDRVHTCGYGIDSGVLWAFARRRDPALLTAVERAVVASYLRYCFGSYPDENLALALTRLAA